MSDKQQSATDYFSEKVFDLFNQLENRVISFTDFRREMRKIEFDSEELFKQQSEFMFECGRNFQMTAEGTFNEVYNETFKTESNGTT